MLETTSSQAVRPCDPLQAEISALLASTLGLGADAIAARADTPVLGVIPELDSMSVMTFLITLEEQYDIVIHDDEVDAAIFQTIGSLTEFLKSKLG